MTSSVVVETFRKATRDALERWRQHRLNGTAHTAEGLQAYEDAKLASAAYAGEVTDRALRELSR
jgi:hypothetical protein